MDQRIDFMNFEDAMFFLRKGEMIYRESKKHNGSLCCTLDKNDQIEQVYGSFYMTIYDIMANDWLMKDDENEEDD